MLDTPPMKRLLGWVVLTVALVFSSALCALQVGLRRFDRLVKRDVEALLTTDVPVIAAVNGAAVGWGMELAVMADLRVASEKARFGELFVLRGLVSDAPGLGRLAQLVG